MKYSAEPLSYPYKVNIIGYNKQGLPYTIVCYGNHNDDLLQTISGNIEALVSEYANALSNSTTSTPQTKTQQLISNISLLLERKAYTMAVTACFEEYEKKWVAGFSFGDCTLKRKQANGSINALAYRQPFNQNLGNIKNCYIFSTEVDKGDTIVSYAHVASHDKKEKKKPGDFNQEGLQSPQRLLRLDSAQEKTLKLENDCIIASVIIPDAKIQRKMQLLACDDIIPKPENQTQQSIDNQIFKTLQDETTRHYTDNKQPPVITQIMAMADDPAVSKTMLAQVLVKTKYLLNFQTDHNHYSQEQIRLCKESQEKYTTFSKNVKSVGYLASGMTMCFFGVVAIAIGVFFACATAGIGTIPGLAATWGALEVFKHGLLILGVLTTGTTLAIGAKATYEGGSTTARHLARIKLSKEMSLFLRTNKGDDNPDERAKNHSDSPSI